MYISSLAGNTSSVVVGVSWDGLRTTSVLVPCANCTHSNESTNVAPVVGVNLINCASFEQLDNSELVVVVTCVT